MSSAALVLLLPALLFTTADTDAGPSRDPLVALAPLLGRWVAEPDPKQPGVTGWTSFEEPRVLSARDGRTASEHEDLMVLFSEDGKLRADYWDNEGHVIRYEVQSPAANHLVFLSEARAGAPRFRLTYAWPQPGRLELTFEIAPPGATEFRPYISARLRRE